jgi:hypothetical protein
MQCVRFSVDYPRWIRLGTAGHETRSDNQEKNEYWSGEHEHKDPERLLPS